MKTTRKENLSTSEASKTIPQKYERQISKLLSEVVDLTLISEKGHGKTVCCENLASQIIRRPDTRLIVFERLGKHDKSIVSYLQ